jgi:hypothetical protein
MNTFTLAIPSLDYDILLLLNKSIINSSLITLLDLEILEIGVLI